MEIATKKVFKGLHVSVSGFTALLTNFASKRSPLFKLMTIIWEYDSQKTKSFEQCLTTNQFNYKIPMKVK